jgi:hypothetical protein
VQLFAAVLQNLGLLFQDEDDRPPDRYDAERLVGGVEHQRSPQALPLLHSDGDVPNHKFTQVNAHIRVHG